jgi:TolB-like protein/DNA-binding winged helix-turn-helix (wHTH) protein
MDSHTQSRRIRFDNFVVDLRTGELMKDGNPVHLQEKPFQILVLLLERQGDLVTRDELRRALWAATDTFVDFDIGLNTAIRKLREALSDSADHPRFVETLPRRGYRFIRSVEREVPQSEIDSITPPVTATEDVAHARPRQVGRRSAYLAAGVVAVVLVAIPLIRYTPLWGLIFPTRVAKIRSVAVLPLENFSGDPAQQYFADGMTDELITMLARNTSLQVVSRTSAMQFKNAHQSMKQIADALHVDAVLEGSLERAGTRLHMTVQLIDASTDTHLWADSYDRDGNQVSSLPADIALAIGRRLNASITVAAPSRPIRPEAYDAYLRGRYFWYAMDYKRAQDFMERAVQLQPDYGVAWSGLSDALAVQTVVGRVPSRQVRSQVQEAYHRALQLDNASSETHNAAAGANLFLEWNWTVADEESQRALAIDPNLALHHHIRAYFLTAMNRLDEALQEERRGAQLAPFQHPFAVGLALLNLRQYDAALEELRLRKEAQPSDPVVRGLLVKCYRLKGMDKEAAMELADLYEVWGNKLEAAAIRDAFRSGGASAVARRGLQTLRSETTKHYVSALDVANAYALLHMKTQTLDALDAAYEERAPMLIFLQSDPDFDFLRSEERYRAIVRKIGLPPADYTGKHQGL